MFKLDNRTARRVLLHLQGLTEPPSRKLDSDQLYDLILRMGLVQVDSIRWVERAQHMILFSRSQHYRPDDLKHLVEDRQLLFENYTHDASVIPAAFFRYWRHRFARDRNKLRDSMVRWQGDGFVTHCRSLSRRIRRDGSLRSRDLEKSKSNGKKEMWQWHDGKAALEFMWRTGKLGIAARDGFQKVYDLTERVIGAEDYEAKCTRPEFIDWACRSAIARLGFGTPAEIAGFWNHVSIPEVNRWLKQQDETVVQCLSIENADGSLTENLLARPDIEEVAENVTNPPPRIRVLSPFDPVIRNRVRLESLFDFHYRIEIYVPAAKRKYGYYVFPLLEGDKLIGRIDMKADRKQDALVIKQVWLEDDVEMTASRKKRLDQELLRVANFAGVGEVTYDHPKAPR